VWLRVQVDLKGGHIRPFIFIEKGTRTGYVIAAYDGDIYVLNEQWASHGAAQSKGPCEVWLVFKIIRVC
jgi:hypothetical protein